MNPENWNDNSGRRPKTGGNVLVRWRWRFLGGRGAWGGGNDEGTKRRRCRCGARSCGVSGESKGPGPDEAGPSRLAAIHLLKMRQGANHNFNLRFAPKSSSSRPTRVSRPPKKNPRNFVRFPPPPASISVESRRMDFSRNGRNMNLTDTKPPGMRHSAVLARMECAWKTRFGRCDFQSRRIRDAQGGAHRSKEPNFAAGCRCVPSAAAKQGTRPPPRKEET